MKSPQQRAAETRRREREQRELRNAYNQKFGIPMVFEWSAKNIKLLKRSLATGKDQPELIAMRKEYERNVRAYDKRREQSLFMCSRLTTKRNTPATSRSGSSGKARVTSTGRSIATTGRSIRSANLWTPKTYGTWVNGRAC